MKIIILVIAVVLLLLTYKVPDDHLIQLAIEHSYPGIYEDLSDLKVDYPNFEPQVKRWSDLPLVIFGLGSYYVTLPEEAVIFSRTGEFMTTRRCSTIDAEVKTLCTITAPKEPELGIVGTVQLQSEGYPPAENFKVTWEGGNGHVFIDGHCFYAYKKSNEPLVLNITGSDYSPIKIENRYGTRIVAVKLGQNNYYGNQRITKELFMKSSTCSKDIRKTWPNVGGWAWKR